MKKILFTMLLLTGSAIGQDYTLHPTFPGTDVRDYSRPSYQVEGNTIYPTINGTDVRDYSKPGYRIEGEQGYNGIPVIQPIPQLEW